MGLSDVLDDWLGFDPPKAPELPQVAPLPTADPGRGTAGALRRMRRGRASTILTGDLVPMDIGKRTLLG